MTQAVVNQVAKEAAKEVAKTVEDEVKAQIIYKLRRKGKNLDGTDRKQLAPEKREAMLLILKNGRLALAKKYKKEVEEKERKEKHVKKILRRRSKALMDTRKAKKRTNILYYL